MWPKHAAGRDSAGESCKSNVYWDGDDNGTDLNAETAEGAEGTLG